MVGVLSPYIAFDTTAANALSRSYGTGTSAFPGQYSYGTRTSIFARRCTLTISHNRTNNSAARWTPKRDGARRQAPSSIGTAYGVVPRAVLASSGAFLT
eukprot:scaffold25423_cov19-Prasinocladus_malaysianus.AAC.1